MYHPECPSCRNQRPRKTDTLLSSTNHSTAMTSWSVFGTGWHLGDWLCGSMPPL